MEPKCEPCGCPWGCADQPFKVEPFGRWAHEDYEFDSRLSRFTECLECGAVWWASQDNAWVLENGR